MAELKTKRTEASVDAFLEGVTDEARRRDCRMLLRMMKKGAGAEPKMWGSGIVGFGSYHYAYGSGQREWFLTGFSPRKNDLTLYLMAGFGQHGTLMAKLGKYKTGKACLYIKRLSDVDLTVLENLISASVKQMQGGRAAKS